MISMLLSEAAKSINSGYHGDDPEFTGCSTDSRKIKQGEMFIALRGERFDGHDFLEDVSAKGASAALVERSTQASLPYILAKDSIIAMGQLARIWRERFSIPLVAITGSNGKTTVKEMLNSILKIDASVLCTRGNLNNEIGVPLTLFELGSEHDYAIVEMGANHPGEIARLTAIAQPTVALITQCAPAHLEGFGNIEGVARAKAEIFDGLNNAGIAIVNKDDDYSEFWLGELRERKYLTFGMSANADINATIKDTCKFTGKTVFVLNILSESIEISMPLPGHHNVINAMAASACAFSMGISSSRIKTGLEKFTGVSGRLQFKAGLNGSRIIDDTYNANPASLKVAINVLSNLDGERWLVLADMGELGEASDLLHIDAGNQAKLGNIERLFTHGQLSKKAMQSFTGPSTYYESIDDLISELRKKVTSKVTVLVKGSRTMKMERVVDALSEEI